MNHKYMRLLGMQVRDKVTDLVGVVVSISFDLYGCIMAVVEQPIDKDGKVPESRWYDCKRLEAIDVVELLEVPEFDETWMHCEMLGLPVFDLVTNFAGVVTSIIYELNGSVQAAVRPSVKNDGTIVDSVWIACRRLQVKGEAVLPVPNFGCAAPGDENGPSEKPARVLRPMQ